MASKKLPPPDLSIPILPKYQKVLDDSTKFLTFSRDIAKRWTLARILQLAFFLEAVDFFVLMVQCKFINTSHVYCPKCKEHMEIARRSREPEGLEWTCKKQRPIPGKYNSFYPACNKTRTVRTNSWFHNSKLSLPEILIITHQWFKRVIKLINN